MRKTELIVLCVCLFAAGCSANSCEELVWNEELETCECPERSVPDYDLDACVFEDGRVVPWGDLNVPYVDAGAGDVSLDRGMPPDVSRDSGPDSLSDEGVDVERGDAGPPPAPTAARFPWNGFNTGSLHVPTDTEVTRHPLRPEFVWEEVDGADHYQIQLTRECDVSTFERCSFESPDLDSRTGDNVYRPSTSLPVSTLQPVGDRYFWRVRSCSATDACSGWTRPRYLNVGRETADYNGDGYADLLVGAMNWGGSSAPGKLYVYNGGGEGLTSAGQILSNPTASLRFRTFVELGDVNADGYSDVAIAGEQTWGPDAPPGVVYVHLGSSSGLQDTPYSVIPAPPELDHGQFGLALSAGDYDGDGYVDIVVGALSDGALVHLYSGGETFSGEPSLVLRSPVVAERTGSELSIASAGDVNGDGYLDLLVGAPFETVDRVAIGSAYVFYGGERGLHSSPDRTIRDPQPERLGQFGFDVAHAGDVNGDGYSDVMIGAPGQSVAGAVYGRVHLFLGSSVGILGAASTSLDNPGEGDFGHTVLSAGDVNGDGFDDLVVGTDEDGGYVILSIDGVPNVDSRISLGDQGVFAAADYDGDGHLDIAAGRPEADSPAKNGGVVQVFPGMVTGVSETSSLTIANPLNEESGAFGRAVR